MTEHDTEAGERQIPVGMVWRYDFEEMEEYHYVIQHPNGSFIGYMGESSKTGFGLSEERVVKRANADGVEVTEVPREETPWQDGWIPGDNQLIPEGMVWEYHFKVSHAPHYIIQHPNGVLLGIYAPVENVPRDTAVPFGQTEETVLEQKNSNHVEVVELPREKTPWADGVYLQ